MIILGVDYGDARTGISVCDKNEMLASPVKVIKQRVPEKLAAEISQLAAELGAELICMGLPKNMDGTLGFRAEACAEFALLLKQTTGLDVIMRDERLTTVSAHQYMNITNTRGEKRKNTVDAVSAVIILEDFLAFRKNNNRK